jgi:hypothetical protein
MGGQTIPSGMPAVPRGSAALSGAAALPIALSYVSFVDAHEDPHPQERCPVL